MNFSDVLAFAKAGWTPADVKEIMKATSEEVKSDEGSLVEQSENVSRETFEEEKSVEESTEEKTEEVDYKALYEAEQKKVQELQKSNINQNIKGLQDNTTDSDVVFDFARSFM